MVDGNPWLTQAPAEAEQPEAVSRALKGPQGPVAPHDGVPAPDTADRLQRREVQWPASMWWLGAHGGAGETTLASLSPGTRAADHAWPIPVRGGLSRVMVVARSNYSGLLAAQRAAIEWASNTLSPDLQVMGLVLIPDAPGKRPKEIEQLERVVAGGFPRLFKMPWVEEWRFAAATSTKLPASYQILLSDLNLYTNNPRY